MRSEVRDWGKRQEGIEIGHNEGERSERLKRISKMLSKGYSAEEIADLYEMPIEDIIAIGKAICKADKKCLRYFIRQTFKSH